MREGQKKCCRVASPPDSSLVCPPEERSEPITFARSKQGPISKDPVGLYAWVLVEDNCDDMKVV